MTSANLHPSDAVFEGGGVKGIALLGALSVMEKVWRWENVAGTSAGAIVAAFTAAGMTSHDIRGILDRVNLTELMDTGWEDKLGRILGTFSPLRFMPGAGQLRGHLISILSDFGIYEGERFIEIINDNLPPGIRAFGDLIYDANLPKDSPYRYKLRVVASDVTANRMLILPQDIRHFGRDPDSLPIAEALRMSMSIPVFFEPWKLRDSKGRIHLIVDGGILSNYPVWMFDTPIGEDPSWPTIGFSLYSAADKADGLAAFPEDVVPIDNAFRFGRGIWNSMFSAMDKRYVAQRHWARTIPIDNLGIAATEFSLSEADRNSLWDSGVKAATDFMNKWGGPEAGFNRWKAAYRGEVEEAQRIANDRYRGRMV